MRTTWLDENQGQQYAVYKTPHVNYKDTDSFKGNGWRKDANINCKKAGMTILISDNADLKKKGISRKRNIS